MKQGSGPPFLLLIWLLLIPVALVGCGGGGGGRNSSNPADSPAPSPSVSGTPHPAPSGTPTSLPVAPRQWNFFVYMDGDNNLEAEAIADLNEMELIGSNNDLNILVLFDRIDGYDTSNGNWSGTRLYKVTRDSNPSLISSEWIQSYNATRPELDMSDPDTLKDFIIYCQRNYPAERTVLTLWNHGGGVYPRSVPGRTLSAAGLNAKGICWDDTTGPDPWNCLTTDEVAQALSGARSSTGKRIDLINLDACVTMMLEMAYQWRNEADYLVGSEANVPGAGNDYDTVLRHLQSNPNLSAQSLCYTLVNDYYGYYSGTGSSTTYSALALRSMPSFDRLMSAFTTFAIALNQTDDLAGAVEAWLNTTYFDYAENRDLYDFAVKLTIYGKDDKVKAAATALRSALESAVLVHRETGIYVGKAHGVAILLPNGATWASYAAPDQYPMLELAAATQWDEFLDQLAAATATVIGNRDTVTFRVSWAGPGNVDAAVSEPYGAVLYSPTETGLNTPNGAFDMNAFYAGTESYSLKSGHQIGYYGFYVRSYSFNGFVSGSLSMNGNAFPFSGVVEEGYRYFLTSEWVRGGAPRFRLSRAVPDGARFGD